MLIKELRISDFLAFSGEHRFELPHSEENNLIVILAPQNTGKTCIIRSLKFLFYEVLPGKVAAPYELINRKSRDATSPGHEVNGWVEATIEHSGQQYILRRTITASRRGKSAWSEGDIKFEEVKRGNKTKFIEDEGTFQRMLETLVPETLFDAFYFQGEPLDGKTLSGVRQIRQHLSSFLHEDKWSDAADAAANVRHAYEKELQKLAEKHKEYSALVSRHSQYQDHVEQLKSELKTKEETLEKVEAEYRAGSAKLRTLGNRDELEQLIQTRTKAEADFEHAEESIERIGDEIAQHVGKTRGIAFLKTAIPKARAVLKQLEDKNVLPGGVKDWFVQQILDAPACVCGEKHTDESREAWREHLERALSGGVSEDLTNVLDAIEGRKAESFNRHLERQMASISSLEADRKAAFQTRQNTETTRTQVQKRLADSPVEQIRELSSAQDKLSTRRASLTGDVKELRKSIEQVEGNIRRLKKDMELKKPKGEKAKKLDRLQSGIERATELTVLLNESRDCLKESYWKILQKLVADAYDGIATDGSRARIDHRSLMPFIQASSEERGGNFGGGQSQLLALAFITGLAKLRKELHTQMKALGIGLRDLDDQSFFMDSPFNHVDRYYSKAILEFLRTGTRQVIILMAKQQWDLVKDLVENEAVRIWGFRLHSPPDLKRKDPTDFHFEVRGKAVNLLEPVNEGEPTFTEPFLICDNG